MSIKVKSRSIIIWNMALFLVLSFLFLHVQIALIREISALNLSLIKLNVFNLKEIMAVLAVAIYAVLNLKKWSRFAFFLAVASVAGFTIFLLRDNFSKIILVTLGFYLITAYYFYQFLILELSEACYNPGFHKGHLFEPMLKKVPIKLIQADKIFFGHLTNWNENSCYIFLQEEIGQLESHLIECEVEFCERNFKSIAHIASVAKDRKSLGVRFQDKESETFNWKNFYLITEQQGITAELIK